MIPAGHEAPEDPGPSADYANRLLALLDVEVRVAAAPEPHPAVQWAESGAMALTGPADGEPLVCPAHLPACARGAAEALRALSGQPLAELGDAALLLGERAALAGLSRQGAASAGGACRFIRAADGWTAVNLARPEDFALLPALLEDEAAADWDGLRRGAASMPAADLVERGRLLGLAMAAEGETPAGAWFALERMGGGARRTGPPVVLDFSSLWAGPLCGHVLGLLGARVMKVESLSRPDGARLGPPAFYDLMNGGKASVALDLAAPEGLAKLRRLLARADIVIDSARPRAWAQMGLDPAEVIAGNPSLTWLSITGHGRANGYWTAYGDDAGVAAGLSAVTPRPGGRPVFVGDAVADPLTGLHAALLAWASWRDGGGRLASLALSGVTAHALAFRRAADPAGRAQAWTEDLRRRGVAAAPPQGRTPRRAARALGADTEAALDDLDAARC
ncbi:CoA transferase [Phenylobacterium sp.]|uniref:CoA transferase n=1 Tax=Phenylobacterium sp. TaxID=1871053 RepID=UPI002F41D5E0